MFRKVFSFLNAIRRGYDPKMVEQRIGICRDCEHVRKGGPGRKLLPILQDEEVAAADLFCAECDCGRWKMAALLSKLGWRNLRCPMNPPKWGSVKALTAKQHAALDKLRQIKVNAKINKKFSKQGKMKGGRTADPTMWNPSMRRHPANQHGPNHSGVAVSAGELDAMQDHNQMIPESVVQAINPGMPAVMPEHYTDEQIAATRRKLAEMHAAKTQERFYEERAKLEQTKQDGAAAEQPTESVEAAENGD